MIIMAPVGASGVTATSFEQAQKVRAVKKSLLDWSVRVFESIQVIFTFTEVKNRLTSGDGH
jgi:hypothetical protein